MAADEGLGLGLLAVPGLTAFPYPFASVSAQELQEVHAATRDAMSGTVALVSGRVLAVEAGAATSDPGFVRHDAFNDWQRNFGAPLLNICGEIIGAVVDDRDPNLASSGSDRAVPGAWLLARFRAVGLAATTADRPCLSAAERAAAAETAAADAERRAAAEAERRRRAEAAADAEANLREQAESTAEAAQVDAAEAAEARRFAEQQSAEAQQQAAADRARYVRWAILGAVGVVVAAGMLFWLAGRRSVAKARQEQVTAETLAQAAQEDLAERAAQDRLASAVPSVFLDGADAEGRPIAVRVPGSAIADAGGAVVGRNPLESALVLDHTEVSRAALPPGCPRECSVHRGSAFNERDDARRRSSDAGRPRGVVPRRRAAGGRPDAHRDARRYESRPPRPQRVTFGAKSDDGGFMRSVAIASTVACLLSWTCGWAAAQPATGLDAVERSVVRVVGDSSTGSGSVVAPGWVLTNQHVVDEQTTLGVVSAHTSGGRRARLAWSSEALDLAVLEVDGLTLPPVTLGTMELRTRERVWALGYPGVADQISPADDVTSTEGVIGRLHTNSWDGGPGRQLDIIQHSADINPATAAGR